MPNGSFSSLIVPNGAAHVVGIILLDVITIHRHHEPAGISRAIASLVIQEEEKIRAEIRAAGAHR